MAKHKKSEDGTPPPDPSMEDILASIRDILNDEESQPPEAPLDLTEAMLVPVEKPNEGATEAPPPVVPAEPPPEVRADVQALPVSEPPPALASAPALQALLAPAAAAAAAAALSELARAVSGDRSAPVARSTGPSIEDVVREELRPLLKAWLDQHLPGMVEDIVKAEITRLIEPPKA